jgi:hypothetical protein
MGTCLTKFENVRKSGILLQEWTGSFKKLISNPSFSKRNLDCGPIFEVRLDSGVRRGMAGIPKVG